MTTQPDIDAIARDAAIECRERDEGFQGIIASAIRRALDPLEQENKDMAKAMALKLKLERHLSEAIEVLKLVEWRGDYSESCPLCGNSINRGHSPGCRLATAIGK